MNRHLLLVSLLAFTSAITLAQGNVQGSATGTCVMPKPYGDGKPHPCSDFNTTTTSTNSTNLNSAAASAVVNAGVDVFYDKLGDLLFGHKNNAADAAAAAAAAAEQQRLAEEQARERALQEKRRQEAFERLSRELMGISGGPQLQLMGINKSSDLQLMGIGKDPDLKLMGVGDSTSSTDEMLRPKGTDFFGLGGGSAATPQPMPEATGDPSVVDLRDLQQGVDLIVAAKNAPPEDQQVILDQALDTANGDKSVKIAMNTSTAAPVVTHDGLLAFQKANAEYRKARDTSYQLRQSFADAQKKCEVGRAFANASRARLEADLQNHIDEMVLAQKQEAMAKIFAATLDQDIACGDQSARLALALQNTDWTRYQTEGVLAKIAQIQPPAKPQSKPISAEDLKLLLPNRPKMDLAKDTVLAPNPAKSERGSSADLRLLLPNQPEMDLVKDTILHQPLKLPAETITVYPPAFAQKYRTDSAFAKAANQKHADIFDKVSKDYRTSADEANGAWQVGIGLLMQKGLVRSDVPLDVQERANSQLHAELDAMRNQITSRLDYQCTLAKYHAENEWSNWIGTQDAVLTGQSPPPHRTAF